MPKEPHYRADVSIRKFNVLNLDKNANRLDQLETTVMPLMCLKIPRFSNAWHFAFATGTRPSLFQDESPCQFANHRKTANLDNINLVLEVVSSKDCNI